MRASGRRVSTSSTSRRPSTRHGPWGRELSITLPFDDDRVRQAVADVFAGAPYRRKGSIWERFALPDFDVEPRIVWGTVAVAIVVLLVFWISRSLSVASERGAPGVGTRSRSRRDDWQTAHELASAGHFSDALHALYAAVIARLARDGRLDPHPAKTSREYAREIGVRHGALRTAFTGFALDYERAVYGGPPPEADDFARVASRARELVPPS